MPHQQRPLLGALALAVLVATDPTDLALIAAYIAGFMTATNTRRGQ